MGLLALGLLGASACGTDHRAVRIVLISLDTLRADALGADRMPASWRRAQGGLIFENYYASSSTTQPTHASLLTGLHPWQHGVTRNGLVLAESFETVTERLAAAGFRTRAVVASFPLESSFGYAQGFDRYLDDFDRHDFVETWEGHRVDTGGFSADSESVLARAFALLAAATERQQFFFFHFYDAHAPYGDDSEAFLTDEIVLRRIAVGESAAEPLIAAARAGYWRDVAHLDGAVDRLLARLASDERFETHIVVVSDHGESLGEDGSMGHGARLTEAQLRGPLFVLSDVVAPGRRSDAVGSVDVAKTLLDLAGLPSDHITARGLLDEQAPQRPVVGMRRSFVEPFTELRVDRTYAIVSGPRFFAVDRGQLLTGDATSLSRGDLPGPVLRGRRADAFRGLFAGFERELHGRQADERTDPGTREALKALGYVR